MESANPRMDSECASGCTWSTARATAPSPGHPTPGVVKQDKSSGGSVDTTKTRSGPQRVRMSSGERSIGAAKGKQSDTEALCQPPPPPSPVGGSEAKKFVCRKIGLKSPIQQGLHGHSPPPPPGVQEGLHNHFIPPPPRYSDTGFHSHLGRSPSLASVPSSHSRLRHIPRKCPSLQQVQ